MSHTGVHIHPFFEVTCVHKNCEVLTIGKSNIFAKTSSSLEGNRYKKSKLSLHTHYFHVHFPIWIDTLYLNQLIKPISGGVG